MSRPSKLDGQEEGIRAMLVAGNPWEEIARSYRVPVTTLKSWAKRVGLRKPKTGYTNPNVEAAPFVAEVSQLDLLEAELAEYKAAARAQKKASVQQQRILTAIESSLHGVELPYHEYQGAVWTDPPGLNGTPKHRQAVLLSDWHAGEVVVPEQVGGLNAFNFEILEARVREVVKSLLSFKNVRPALTGLDLWFLGDMISGDIHEELQITNQFPAAEQAVKVGYLMGWLVAELAPHYADLFCVGVPGNHARMPKQHASKNVHDSWDWTAYQLAKAYTRDLENVHWEIPRAGTYIRRIAGKDILIAHGDGIRSSMPGVPEGGVNRRYNALTQQFASQGTIIDGMAYGHFHSSGVRKRRLFGNGSLIGVNEHGYKNYGDGEDPCQILLTWNEAKSRLTDVSYITPTTGVNPGQEA